jgi:nucleotide-binding universal stress UspA family protein
MMDSSQDTAHPIVVGIDGSETARHAVVWAAREAARRQAALTIVHVCLPLEFGPPRAVPLPRSFGEAMMIQGRAWLDEAAAAARTAEPDIQVSTDLVRADIAPALIARSTSAQLMVLGSRGLGGFTGLLVGSIAVALTSHSRGPVAIVRTADPDAQPPTTGPVVVGVDGPNSDAAVDYAFEAASLRGVPLVAVHTWTESLEPSNWDAVPFVADWDAIEQAHWEHLSELLARWRQKYPHVELKELVVRGRPAHSLIRQSRKAQLVVVGSRGRGGFTGLLLGSTSHALLNHSACPVVVARAHV